MDNMQIFPRDFENQILNSLAVHGPLNSTQLAKYLKIDFSMPNLYKKLNQLLNLHILDKNGKYYSLNRKRIMGYLGFGDILKQTYLGISNLDLNIDQGEKLEFRANSLFELDAIWSSKLSQLNLLHNYTERNYIYNSHAYHIIGMPEGDNELFELIGKYTPGTSYLIGNDTAMDLSGRDQISKISGNDVICTKNHEFPFDGYFVNIVGNYYIEMQMPVLLSNYFKTHFDEIRSINNLDLKVFKQLFHMKMPMHINVYHNPKYAKVLANKIKKCFDENRRNSI